MTTDVARSLYAHLVEVAGASPEAAHREAFVVAMGAGIGSWTFAWSAGGTATLYVFSRRWRVVADGLTDAGMRARVAVINAGLARLRDRLVPGRRPAPVAAMVGVPSETLEMLAGRVVSGVRVGVGASRRLAVMALALSRENGMLRSEVLRLWGETAAQGDASLAAIVERSTRLAVDRPGAEAERLAGDVTYLVEEVRRLRAMASLRSAGAGPPGALPGA